MPRIAVLVSGAGSNLKALLDHQPYLPIALVIADRICPACEVAEKASIRVKRPLVQSFRFNREAYSEYVLAYLLREHIDLVVMAGFMTILHENILQAFPNRVLNIHPALLPDFKGRYAVRDTLAAGVKWTGPTVHLATQEVDAGKILGQSHVEVYPGDSEESLHARLKEAEHKLYPVVVERYLKKLGY